MEEEWRPVPGFPGFQVSSLGRLKGKRGNILRGHKRDGYIHFYYHDGFNKYRGISAQIAVCLAFIGPRPTPKHEAAHWDGSRDNNRLDNLRWASPEEQHADKLRHGRVRFGSDHPTAKLTVESVVEIRKRFAHGCSKYRLAKDFGVTRASIANIINGKTWVGVHDQHE